MDPNYPNILVADSISEEGIERLQKEANVDALTKITKEELLEIIDRYDALVVRSRTKVTKDIIDRGTRLKAIGRAGVGVDNIDVEAATDKGIIVINAPEGNTISAAEHTIAMLLSMARKIPHANSSVKNGEWKKNDFTGIEVREKILGIIGFGRIGSYVAKMAHGLGMNVIAYDPYVVPANVEKTGGIKVDFDTILKDSDFITVHVPLTKKTTGLIGANEFKKMKKGVRIINCARGGIIDETALYNAIKDGIVAGAALDVFVNEPPKDNPLLGLDEVIVTPHLAASTIEAQKNVAIIIANQVLAALKDEPVMNAVNMPAIPKDALITIRPYIPLAEKLGKIASQLVEGTILRVKMIYRGDIAGYNTEYITKSALVGILSNILNEHINLINAPVIASRRGINISEEKSKDIEDLTSSITLEVETESMKKVLSGTIFGKSEERIIGIDGFKINVIPSKYMLISNHTDRPSIVGKIGKLLGDEDINIAAMELGRKKPRGEAIMVLNVDSPIPDRILEEIRKIEGIHDALLVSI
ncbi:MAG TPA: phosphoglycerate dehydrogenase [Halobacteria archaeon]|nr:phosphoglycerate dehydrogenase [Halobacteria archaeon]